MFILTKILTVVLNFLFPPECLGCGQENFYLCPHCLEKISFCLPDKPDKNQTSLTYLNGIITACPYSQPLLKKAIHNFKFGLLEKLSRPLSLLMIKYFWQINGQKTFADYIIIPVPLFKKRFLERGFNQAELLAETFAAGFNLAYSANLIARTKNTPHQVGLKRNDRLENIKSCFTVLKPEIVKNSKIILIDDVITTGSTLNETAKVLAEAGAKEVWAFALAKD